MENIDIFDPQYVQKQQIAWLKAKADEQNAARLATYNGQCEEWKTVNTVNRSKGLPITPLPKQPLKLVVADDGREYETAWEGLQTPVLPAENLEERRTDIKAPAGAIPPDRLDQVLACLQVLNAKLDQALARLAR